MSEITFYINDELVEQLKAIFVEGEFNSRMALIMAYHEAGGLILTSFEEKNISQAVQALAEKIGKSERMIWYAVKFAQLYPSLDALPEGKNISMNKIITKYLTTSKQEECTHERKKVVSFEVCEDCGKKLDMV